jgi:hypothetical protein
MKKEIERLGKELEDKNSILKEKEGLKRDD